MVYSTKMRAVFGLKTPTGLAPSQLADRKNDRAALLGGLHSRLYASTPVT